MSVCYDLVCHDCEVRWAGIGQTGGENGKYFYNPNEVFGFLFEHNKHRIGYYTDNAYIQEIEDMDIVNCDDPKRKKE